MSAPGIAPGSIVTLLNAPAVNSGSAVITPPTPAWEQAEHGRDTAASTAISPAVTTPVLNRCMHRKISYTPNAPSSLNTSFWRQVRPSGHNYHLRRSVIPALGRLPQPMCTPTHWLKHPTFLSTGGITTHPKTQIANIGRPINKRQHQK